MPSFGGSGRAVVRRNGESRPSPTVPTTMISAQPRAPVSVCTDTDPVTVEQHGARGWSPYDERTTVRGVARLVYTWLHG